MPVTTDKPMKVAFIHPDLGIGGAERLVIDAALSLKTVKNKSNKPNDVTIFTSHCDFHHCFEEVKNKELKVEVYGDFLPRNILGKFFIVCAFLRQLWLVLTLICTGQLKRFDVIFVDQLAYCIPLLHYFKRSDAKILFYCHFPDKLLASHQGLLRKMYRMIFDYIEEWTTATSDIIVVNSKFTKRTVQKQFKSLTELNKPLSVVYPCVPAEIERADSADKSVAKLMGGHPYFLSINRFEGKKHVELAIEAYAQYMLNPKADRSERLVISGGYDDLVEENKTVLEKLQGICQNLNLSSVTVFDIDDINKASDAQVLFMPSVSTPVKNAFLAGADALLYTPSYEHFGIVPLEAMKLGRIVVADNTGGPLETVVNYSDHKDTFTGFTQHADPKTWGDILAFIKSIPGKELKQVSLRCQDRVEKHFSSGAMQQDLCDAINGSEPVVYSYERVIPYISVVVALLAIYKAFL